MPELLLSGSLGQFLRQVGLLLSRTPALVPLLALPWLARWCYRAWARAGDRRIARWAAGSVLVPGLADGLLLAALPHLGLSFAPVGLPWLMILLVRVGIAQGAAALARRRPGGAAGLLLSAALLHLLLLGCAVDALYVEPFNLKVSQVQVSVPAALPSPIRVVQLSDLHVERTTKRERAVLETVRQLEPDLILLTGDYLNTCYLEDARARQDVRELLGQLRAPYGIYAVSGTPTVDTAGVMAALFADMDHITVLDDAYVRLDLEGESLYLVGVSNRAWARDRQKLEELMGQLPPDAWTILLYHTPDLAGAAAKLGVNLYLAGHTHGGQIRLPWFGALLTASRYWKRYEAGLYRVGETRLYVSRGIGMEGQGMPRARFLCPPEIVEIVLMGAGSRE